MSKEKFRSWLKALRRFIPFVVLGVTLGLFGDNLLEPLREWSGLERLLRVGQGRAQDFAFIALSLLLSYLIVRRQRSARLDSVQVAFLIGGLELYGIARWGDLDKFLVRFDACSAIAYGDVLAAPALLSLLLWGYSLLPSRKKSAAPSAPSFDASLGEGVDLFGYGNLARRVKDYILDPKNPTSGTIGINGVFGIGKSSFLDLLIRELNGKGVKVIHFTPWRASSKSFLSQLVDQLVRSELGEEGAIVSALEEYESLLSEVKIPAGIGKLFRAKRIGSENSESNAKQLVSQLLSKHKQRCLVIVDDLDRLMPAEIVEVLKLLRNTADFDRITYVLAYDKVLVEESLRREQPVGTEFLDKFIEAELVLPVIDISRLIDLCFSKLQELMPESTATFSEASFRMEVTHQLAHHIETPRQAKRLALTTKLTYSTLATDIHLPDALVLQSLRLRYPKVVASIARHSSRFFDIGSHAQDPNPTYHLSRTQGNDKSTLQIFIESHRESLGLSEAQSVEALNSIAALFNGNRFPRDAHYYSICYPRNFKRYFALELSDGTLPRKEYERIVALPEDERHRAMVSILDNGQTSSFCHLTEADETTSNTELISILVELARIEVTRPDGHRSSLADSYRWFGARLSRYRTNSAQNALTKEHLLILFGNAPYPAYVERNLLAGMLHSNHSILTVSECHHLLHRYISEVISTEKEWSKTVARALFDCFHTGWEEISPTSSRSMRMAISTAKELFDEALKKFGAKRFLEFWIEEMPFAEIDNPKYAVRKEALLVYSNWQGFELRIEELPDEACRSEFLEFFEVFKATGLSQFVPFTFRLLRN